MPFPIGTHGDDEEDGRSKNRMLYIIFNINKYIYIYMRVVNVLPTVAFAVRS